MPRSERAAPGKAVPALWWEAQEKGQFGEASRAQFALFGFYPHESQRNESLLG